MKTLLLATILTLSASSAWSCGLIGLLTNPDCKPANELLAEDMATCRAHKLEINACLQYLQNARTTRLLMRAEAARRMQRAMEIDVPQYQPPAAPAIRTWRPTCANANLIGC